MEERFSFYLSEIGLLNETASSSFIKKDDKASNKSFADTSFECLKNFFDNLDEEQKKYMSIYIPTKYIEITDKIRKTKLKSIIIQLILRHKLIVLKYFLKWRNIYLFEKLNNNNNPNDKIENKNEITENEKDNSGENIFNNIASKYLNNQNINNNKDQKENNDNISEYKDNISKYNIVNIDNNEDVEKKNISKFEEEKEKMNKSNQNNSISFGNIILKNNFNSENNKNNKIKSNNFKNKNNNNKNKEKNVINSYIYKNNNKNINQIKKQVNINSYKTINTNNIRKQTNRSQYNTNNNNNSSIRNSNTKNNLHTSLEEKEIKELKECTFKPKINNPQKRFKRILSQNDINSSLIIKKNVENNQKREEEIQFRFEKLYKDNEKYKLSKEMKALEFEHMMSRNTPFIPNIKQKLKKRLFKTRQKSEGNFEDRQKEYLNKKNKHSAEIKNKINSDFEELCSFNPKITNDKGEYYQFTIKEKINNKPVFTRLYEDVKNRKNVQIKRENDKYNKIMDLSNIMNPQKNFNYETINRLHENKGKKDVVDKTRKKVEEEEGVTFKPYISENSYYRGVNGNFYQRGQKLLNDRESFYEEENKKYIEEYRNNVEKKPYTKEERKIIINNIINRLYNDSVQKNKKSIKDQKIRNFKSYCE